jgi:hypothetical protein
MAQLKAVQARTAARHTRARAHTHAHAPEVPRGLCIAWKRAARRCDCGAAANARGCTPRLPVGHRSGSMGSRGGASSSGGGGSCARRACARCQRPRPSRPSSTGGVRHGDGRAACGMATGARRAACDARRGVACGMATGALTPRASAWQVRVPLQRHPAARAHPEGLDRGAAACTAGSLVAAAHVTVRPVGGPMPLCIPSIAA